MDKDDKFFILGFIFFALVYGGLYTTLADRYIITYEDYINNCEPIEFFCIVASLIITGIVGSVGYSILHRKDIILVQKKLDGSDLCE